MKNAGMAGAVALVGIGLITIGLGKQPIAAMATQASEMIERPPVMDQSKRSRDAARGGDPCDIEIFEMVLNAYSTDCDDGNSFGGNGSAYVDLLGLGEDQIVSGGIVNLIEGCGGSVGPIDYPIKIGTPNGLRYIQTDLAPGGPLDYASVLGLDPCGISVAGYLDVDLDGRADLLLRVDTLEGQRAYGWLRNIYDGPARLPADLDNDGDVDGADLGKLFSQWTG